MLFCSASAGICKPKRKCLTVYDCCFSSPPIIIPQNLWDPNQQVWDISNTATGKWPYCILSDNFTLFYMIILAFICLFYRWYNNYRSPNHDHPEPGCGLQKFHPEQMQFWQWHSHHLSLSRRWRILQFPLPSHVWGQAIAGGQVQLFHLRLH